MAAEAEVAGGTLKVRVGEETDWCMEARVNDGENNWNMLKRKSE